MMGEAAAEGMVVGVAGAGAGPGLRLHWASIPMANTRFRLCFGVPCEARRIAVGDWWLRGRRRSRWIALEGCRRLTEDGGGDTVLLPGSRKRVHCLDGFEDRWGDIEKRAVLGRRRRMVAVRLEALVTVVVRRGQGYSSGQVLAVVVGRLEEGSCTVAGTVGRTVVGTLMLPGEIHSHDAL